jgi:hypothetical protein
MELDELKSLLNQKLTTEHSGRSADDIAFLLTRKTGSVIDKLKRSLRIEVICCIAAILLFAYLGIWGQFNALRIYFSVFALLSVVFLGILIHLCNRIRDLSATTLPVKSNLQTIVNIIQEFSKRYFQFTMALLPICFVFAFVLGYTEHDKPDMPFLDKVVASKLNTGWKIISFLVVYLVVLSTGIYYFTKWYLYKLYGRYVAQLKECIRDLEEQE